MKQRETERLCRHCQKTPCPKLSGVTCHAIYMRLWRLKKREELERLRIEARRQRMREMVERADKAVGQRPDRPIFKRVRSTRGAGPAQKEETR